VVLGYSRQYVYKQQADGLRRERKRREVKALVDRQRKLLPVLGTRKIYHLIKGELCSQGLKLGRDGLFDLMREYGMLVVPRRRYMQTTMSKHWLRKWPNMVKGLAIEEADQVWVSDITYIKTRTGNCYLNMVTDAYSRKIVGYALDDTMETGSMIRALEMAQRNKKNKGRHTIHHSDRGLQYCSRDYVEAAKKYNITLSMTENSDPYENALAERMNRTIKEEFGLYGKPADKDELLMILKESIDLYNTKRPHLSLKMATPDEVYYKKIPTAF
jgi:putative transposase